MAGWSRDVSLCHFVENGSLANPASYSMDTGSSFYRDRAARALDRPLILILTFTSQPDTIIVWYLDRQTELQQMHMNNFR